MKRLLLTAVSLFMVNPIAAGSPKSSFFQIRPVLNSPSADSEQMNYTSKDGQLQVLNMQKTPLLDLNAVASAAVMTHTPNSPFAVKVTFTDKGREQFAALTKQNIHKRIAIMIDGKVSAAPIIQAEISSGWISWATLPRKSKPRR